MKKVCAIILMIIGISLLLYPAIGEYFNKNEQLKAVKRYQQDIVQMSEQKKQDIRTNYTKYNDILGYIEIPLIDVLLPIYPNTEEKNLLKGVGIFGISPLPSKNSSYHCGLVGHTGINAKILFDNLNKLVEGDVFYINILNEKFQYEVCNTTIVLPDETESLITKENDKLVTLVTCTPKYVNSHRLLVTGKNVLINYEEANK